MRIAALLAAAALSAGAGPGDDGLFHAGGYSWSDELGGFRILSTSGDGTREKPVEILQDLHSASPVTMVVRATRPVQPYAMGDRFSTGMIHVRLTTRNASGLPWLEFEFELQEELGRSSSFGDGLSFDQRRPSAETGSSDRYAEHRRHFEPYDGLLFRRGTVDAGESVEFRFFITDFTPQETFYLRQDPQIPFS